MLCNSCAIKFYRKFYCSYDQSLSCSVEHIPQDRPIPRTSFTSGAPTMPLRRRDSDVNELTK